MLQRGCRFAGVVLRPIWGGAFGALRWVGSPVRLRRWAFRLLRIAMVLVLLLGAALAGMVHSMLRVTLPPVAVPNQVSILTYADGSPLATVGAWHQIDVPLSQVPLSVRRAVLAAENRNFYTDHGLSLTGTVRAVLSNVRGGALQGGSTISQQYVKNAYLGPERTFSRKFRELAISLKLNQDVPKDRILELYLNAICFGRGAYGIEAAAQTFFGKHASALTVAEGAVLAGGIKSPALLDPAAHPTEARERWGYVLDAMVEAGWLSWAQRSALRYPRVLPRNGGLFSENAGPNGLVLQQVREELDANGIDEALLGHGRLRVVTTLDPRAQPAALRTVATALRGQPSQLRAALISIDPASGAIRAWYGGPSGTGHDYLLGSRQPGSTFKPFALAAAVELGWSVFSTLDGSSPRTFYGMPHPIRNADNAQCPQCTLVEATTRSINTAYYDLALQIGGRSIAGMAHRLGIPARDGRRKPTLQEKNGLVLAQIVLGKYEVRPVDLAVAYATLAAGGMRRAPYLVEKVLDEQGRVIYQHTAAAPVRAVEPQVANEVAYAMRPVLGYHGKALPTAREASVKTGTVGLNGRDNKDAWTAGFTTQLATVVWLGTDRSRPIRTAAGSPIDGGGLPATIWQRYTDAALAGRWIDNRLTLLPAPYPYWDTVRARFGDGSIGMPLPPHVDAASLPTR